MKRVIPKLRYLLGSVVTYSDPARRRCPNCGGGPGSTIETKYIVTRLVECDNCYLRYRIPTDDPRKIESFYQDSYEQGFTTDCPTPEELARLFESRFSGHEKDFRRFIDFFRILSPQTPLNICDFGCSWGYGAWQFQQSGHTVTGYEVSKPRAEYGREKLGIQIESDLNRCAGQFDIFFSNHVLEHVPVINEVWELAKLTLKPRGIFVATTPNGSDAHRKMDPIGYSQRWGKVHPSFITDRFYQKLFRDRPYFLTSTPFGADDVADWDKQRQQTSQMGGSELLAIALNNG